MEQTKLSPGIKVAAAVVVLVGILAQCGGFFLHMLIGQPGAFYPFVDSPVSRFTDKTTSLSEVFGARGNALEKAILAAGEDEERIELAEAFLRSRRPERDERVELINEIIEHVAADHWIGASL